MKDRTKKMFDYFANEDNLKDIMKLYEEFVNLEGSGREAESAQKAGAWLMNLFVSEGFECEMVDAKPNAGTIVGVYGKNIDEKPIIFSGHYDLALLDGTYGSKFTIKDGKAYGCGTLDMRGGIMISLFVIRALKAIHYNERPIKIIFSGDEEISHCNSNGAEILQREAEDGFIAFNMETGLIDNSLCIGRKGRLEYEVAVSGVEAHAGNDFESGKNAIVEMCRKLVEISELTDLVQGTTVNVGVISGGTIANTVPGECKATIDIRLSTQEENDRIKKAVKKILSKTYIEGTSTAYNIPAEMAAYETTDDVLRFYNFVKSTAQKHGLPEVKNTVLGGVSDAAYITIAGTPVICSFGIQGQWNHTVREYAVLDSILDRAKLISSVISDIEPYDLV